MKTFSAWCSKLAAIVIGCGCLIAWNLSAEEMTDAAAEAKAAQAYADHSKLFAENEYPPATACRTCHRNHYREWSVSAHAYAQLSPVFNAFQGLSTKLTSGANGDFCIRCHDQAGMNLGEKTFMSNMDRCQVSREGITCIVCHRVANEYGKVSGRFALMKGDLTDSSKGPTGDAELKRVLASPDTYHVVTNSAARGRKIHGDIKKFFQLTEPAFCGACHDVTQPNGFRLEEAFSSFKNSPAAHRGETCQDCHMGLIPGKKSGYAFGPAATVGGQPTRPRKLTNHMFAGPDYSIIHKGLFPHNPNAMELASMRDWLLFNDEAGWGTDEFEKHVPKDYQFPKPWASVDDRYEARGILNQQTALLEEVKKQRLTLLRQGYQLGDLVVKQADKHGLKFKIQVKNGTDGHNTPTGFDAERMTYMQVFVTDDSGKPVFKSGDLDPNGDVRDVLSVYVRNNELPLDKYLFTLQSHFIIHSVRGGDREQVLAINYSADPLPFIRPPQFASSFTGRPDGARLQRRGIEALGSRWADYEVKASELTGPGPYHVRIRFLAGMVPVNLVNEIKSVGFDYNMSARQVADAVVKGQSLLYDKEVTLTLDGAKPTIHLANEPDRPATYAQK